MITLLVVCNDMGSLLFEEKHAFSLSHTKFSPLKTLELWMPLLNCVE